MLLGLIDLFHNDFSIPQIPRGPLSLVFVLQFYWKYCSLFKKWVSHFGTNKLYSIEPNLWLLLNWVGFLIKILVIKINTFFHLCYFFLSYSSSSSSSSFFFFFFFLVLLYDPLALLQTIFTGCENSCNPRQLQFEADINKLFVLMCKDRDQISSVDHLIGFY